MLNEIFLLYSGVKEDHDHALRDTAPREIGWNHRRHRIKTSRFNNNKKTPSKSLWGIEKPWATRSKSHDLQTNAHARRLGFLVPSKHCQKVRTVIQKDAKKILKAHLRSHYWGCSVLIRVHDNWRNFLWGLTEDVHIVFLLTHILRCCNNKIFTHFYLNKIWYYPEPKLAALLVWWRDYRRKKILHKVM